MKQVENFLLTALPGFFGVVGFFSLPWNNTEKFLLIFGFSTLYFLLFVIHLLKKLSRSQKDLTSLNAELTQLKNTKKNSDESIDKYDNFVHKRKLFIHHDLPKLVVLITEFEVNVKDSYRGQKQQELRVLTTNVKNKTIEIINKEKRDFDDQLYKIQSNQDY
ncbi:hypothetical protein [Bacillus wiedmannii]|uniref:hypothetical protein n=1 Tax=Bacillus wiedmannii TaxID=1890302 RepID=UPI000BF13DFA|nr:hypothetical protein [Bacillus wiedmannii]PEL93059.1 hypothetical protein CN626_08605 [Bacillus wiedmannii]